MQEGSDALKTALRVLTAVTEHREPEEADIQALHSYAPLLKRRPPDEIACEVIQRALKSLDRVCAGTEGG